MGVDLPVEERLQLQATFWDMAAHALGALDVCLDGGVQAAMRRGPSAG